MDDRVRSRWYEQLYILVRSDQAMGRASKVALRNIQGPSRELADKKYFHELCML